MKEKISVKTLYLLGIITIGLIFLGVGSTYAMFTSTIEIKDPITIYAILSSESDIIETIDIEIEPNDIRVAVINLNNTSNTTLNYASFYITESSDIEVGVTHNFTDTAVPTGSISNGTTKKVYIQVKNNGSSTTNVILGILSNSSNIIKSESMTLIEDTNIDITTPELLITGQDMIVQDGLIRYYDGNNNSGYSHSSDATTWKDLSGNYDGTLTNTTWDTTAVIFNGENSYATLGELPELTTITMEATIIINDFNMTYPNIFNNVSATGTALYFAADHKPRFRLYDGTTKVNVTSDETLDTGVLHTITATYDGTTAKIYIDGIVTKSYAIANAVISPNTTKEMIIGRNPNTDGWLNAKIYSARIYNRALTETEIKQNMNADRISAKSASSDVNGTYTFISNKRLGNFTANSITLTNGTKGTFTKVNDRKYNLNISGVAVSSTLGVDISENIFTDISGNNNNALTLSRYRDGTGPSATITKDTSTSRTVTYTFTFHEYTYNFTSDDITISEGTKGTFTKVNQKTYKLVVTHASDGSKTITVNANSCNDRFGNLNKVKSLTHTIDSVKPTVTIAKSTSTSRTVTYTFTFSEAVTGFTANSVTISEGTKGTFTKVSDSKYTLVVTHASDGSKTITVAAGACKDTAGNSNTAKTLTHTIDSIKPTVTITKNTSTSRKVTYTFTFSEAVTGFTASSVTVSEGTKGTFTKVSDSKYTLVVTHASDGSKTITVASGACKDTAGNGNTAKTLTHAIDSAKPTITSIATKAAINSNTITATLKDNSALAGYAITTSSTNSCSGTAPTSWTSISGTSYSLSKKVTTYGTHYIWTKDALGNTTCTSKLIYKITYTTKETDTCKINSATVTESSSTIKLAINATCACADLQTCKSSNTDKGTDTDRAELRLYIYGPTTVTYDLGNISGRGYFRNVFTMDADGNKIQAEEGATVTAYSNGLIRTTVGNGRTSTVNDVSTIVSKIVADSTTIYNGGFVSY